MHSSKVAQAGFLSGSVGWGMSMRQTNSTLTVLHMGDLLLQLVRIHYSQQQDGPVHANLHCSTLLCCAAWHSAPLNITVQRKSVRLKAQHGVTQLG